MNIVVVMEAQAHHKDILRKAAGEDSISFVYDAPESEQLDAIKTADVIIGNVTPAVLAQAGNLQWLQLNSAGSNEYCVPGVLPKNVQLTNATGAYGVAIAEYMVGVVLSMTKKLYAYADNQKQAQWHDEGPVPALYGANVLVVGYGDIGSRFGKLMKAFGAHVIGIRRRIGDVPPECDAMGTMEDMDAFAKEADIVAASLPETPATHHFFNGERFAAMKKGAFFVNIGRGTSVVQEDLCAALRSGHLAGAAIDVTDPEPLPADSPLWTTPNLHITPHVSGGYHVQVTHDLIVDIAARNICRFRNGEELENQVDFTTGYKK